VPATEAITVLLPVGPAIAQSASRLDLFAHALTSVLNQSVPASEVLILLNGVAADPASALSRRVEMLRGGSGGSQHNSNPRLPGFPRIRFVKLENANLSAALNRGLLLATTPLVARMDDDDTCSPDRFALQAAKLTANPLLAAVGCAFTLADDSGRTIAIQTPPLTPQHASWMLLLENTYAHGSMMLRRDVILAVNGYDKTLPRAQDYDLWLRCRWGMASVPQLLYSYRVPATTGYSASPLQALCAAQIKTRAWSTLPFRDCPLITNALAAAMAGNLNPADAGTTTDAINVIANRMTRSGPTVQSLLAYMSAKALLPAQPATCGRLLRDRAAIVTELLKSQGVDEVYLYGAGAHTAQALPIFTAGGLAVQGIIDNAAAGLSRFNYVVRDDESLARGDHLVLSSRAHHQRMWHATQPLRDRGVHVHPLYDSPAPSLLT